MDPEFGYGQKEHEDLALEYKKMYYHFETKHIPQTDTVNGWNPANQ